MCAIVIGCSGAIAMSLIIRKKQVEKTKEATGGCDNSA